MGMFLSPCKSRSKFPTTSKSTTTLTSLSLLLTRLLFPERSKFLLMSLTPLKELSMFLMKLSSPSKSKFLNTRKLSDKYLFLTMSSKLSNALSKFLSPNRFLCHTPSKGNAPSPLNVKFLCPLNKSFSVPWNSTSPFLMLSKLLSPAKLRYPCHALLLNLSKLQLLSKLSQPLELLPPFSLLLPPEHLSQPLEPLFLTQLPVPSEALLVALTQVLLRFSVKSF